MGRRDRHKKAARKSPHLEQRPVVLVFCEGSVTEKDYFESFARTHRQTAVTLKVADRHGTPKTLVDHAKDAKTAAEKWARKAADESLSYDAVWCVFDVDDHPLLHEARETAAANGIQLAVSNPSFELWLLLHFREQPGMQHRDHIREMLQAEAPGYDKRLSFEQVQHGYANAVRRARQLDQAAEQADEPGRNPSTGVYRLTEYVRTGGTS